MKFEEPGVGLANLGLIAKRLKQEEENLNAKLLRAMWSLETLAKMKSQILDLATQRTLIENQISFFSD